MCQGAVIVIKNNEIMPSAAIWMDWRWPAKSEKDKYHATSLIGRNPKMAALE